MKTKAYYKSDLADIIEMCQDYIDQSIKQEQEAYQQELNEVCNDFSKLVQSGIFHDAIGKVITTIGDEKCIAVMVINEY